MVRRWIVGALLLGAFFGLGLAGLQTTGPSSGPPLESAWALDAAPQSTQAGRVPTVQSAQPTEDVPDKARTLLAKLEARHGEPLPGYVGGRDFQNRERRLPQGRYREYDVNPKLRGRSRDAERIVIEQRSGKAYYTSDHYRTFVPLN